MKRQTGDARFPIWLLGDSEPDRWRQRLEAPLDPRHPIRHNVWTAVLDVIQDEVFRRLGRRVDAGKMFIRNAVQDPAVKPSNPFDVLLVWHSDALADLDEYRRLIDANRPKIIIPFGWFAFAFALRAVGETHIAGSIKGSQTGHIGDQFRKRVAEFSLLKPNVLPLLHRSIAGGRFLSGHSEFCGSSDGNYFMEAGNAIADLLVRHHADIDCWVRAPSASLMSMGLVQNRR